MPIKPENKARYPKNWKSEIRPAILARAQNKCEFCGIENYRIVRRYFNRKLDSWKDVRIVLTIAHLDHTPENCDPENLKALCQQCHNRYDMSYRIKNRTKTKQQERGE